MKTVDFRVWETGEAPEGRVKKVAGLGRVLLSSRASGPVLGDSVRADSISLDPKGKKVAFSVYQTY